MAGYFTVVVAHNVVQAIEPSEAPPGEPVAATPLEAGTELATNYRVRGCIDGRYHFDDAARARTFASLCLEFTRALVDKRLEEVNRLPAGSPAYRAEAGGHDPGAADGRAG